MVTSTRCSTVYATECNTTARGLGARGHRKHLRSRAKHSPGLLRCLTFATILLHNKATLSATSCYVRSAPCHPTRCPWGQLTMAACQATGPEACNLRSASDQYLVKCSADLKRGDKGPAVLQARPAAFEPLGPTCMPSCAPTQGATHVDWHKTKRW